MGKIYGNTIGGVAPVNVFELELDDGTVLNGVVAEEPPVITARPKDIRIGKTAILGDGIVEGENTINYRTTQAFRLILPGNSFSIPLRMYNMYDYTKFQAIVVVHKNKYDTSAEAMYFTINDIVFDARTSNKLSDITKNTETESIELNINNDSENIYSIRYMTYREEEE
jgi:hypothetical protein